LRLIRTEKPNLEIKFRGQSLLKPNLVLRDVSGSNIGAVGVVFGYKPVDDKIALQRRAEQVQAGLSRRITNSGNLFEPVPLQPQPSCCTPGPASWSTPLGQASGVADPGIACEAAGSSGGRDRGVEISGASARRPTRTTWE